MTLKIISFCFLFLVTTNAEYYNKKWFTVPLDHKNFINKKSFKIKYLENDDHWDWNGGPIFFYTGGSEPIEPIASAKGFMWEIAPKFKAKIVFAEHRYYGDSMPPADGSRNNDDVNYPMGYLSVTQAVSDYANLLYSMESGTKYPVITFGASYGGMLSAYMRMKYPHLVAGAIASSVPIYFNVPCDTFHKSVTSTFALANANCSINIKNSWDVIKDFTKNTYNYKWLTTNWKLCKLLDAYNDKIVVVNKAMKYLEGLYVGMAMFNYPYSSGPTGYVAEPVRSVCQYLSKLLTGKPLLEAISKVLGEFKLNECDEDRLSHNDHRDIDTTSYMWGYQMCSEMSQKLCSTGVDDMFLPAPFSQTLLDQYCYKSFGVQPKYNWAEVELGEDLFQAASNIVFSNGLLDPWAGYGVLKNVSKTVKAVVMNDTAHALDLKLSNAADPPSVRTARQFHKDNIRKWIRNFRRDQTKNSSNSE